MVALENPLIGVAVGALFTAVVQSSSATTGIVIVLAQQGLITLETGIALVLGANVGTSITALLAAIGQAHVRLCVRRSLTLCSTSVGSSSWIPFVGILAAAVMNIGGDTAREIANAHTIFNVFNALLVLAVTPQFARFIERIVPDRPEAGGSCHQGQVSGSSLHQHTLSCDRSGEARASAYGRPGAGNAGRRCSGGDLRR